METGIAGTFGKTCPVSSKSSERSLRGRCRASFFKTWEDSRIAIPSKVWPVRHGKSRQGDQELREGIPVS